MMVLVSVQRTDAEAILAGQRKWLFFKRTTKGKTPIQQLALYVPTPIQKVVGYVEISTVLCAPPSSIWELTCTDAGICHNAFQRYVGDATQVYALRVGKRYAMKEPIPLAKLYKRPQGMRSCTFGEWNEIDQQEVPIN